MTVKRRRYGATGHGYTLDGDKVPGVTTVLKMLPSDNLIDWSARSGADEAVNCWDELAELPLMERHNRIRYARNRIRDAAARRGTEVHALASRLVEGEAVRVPDELAGHVEAYRDWLDAVNPEPIATELVVASRAHRYCGTADLVADLPDIGYDAQIIPAARWLLELKTTASGVWPESAIQATAYSHAEVYVHPEHPDDEQPMAILGIERCGVVWIKSDTCELRPVDTTDRVWEAFLHLRWMHEVKDEMKGWVGGAAYPADMALA